MKKLVLLALVVIMLPAIASAQNPSIKQGDPGFYFDFAGGTIEVLRGETWCFNAYAMQYYWSSATCTEFMDTFAVVSSELQEWPLTNVFLGFEQGTEGEDAEGTCYIINDDGDPDNSWYFVTEVCMSIPCDAFVGDENTLTLQMAYCDDQMVAQPDSGDCENPNMHAEVPRWSLISQDFIIAESPPAMYILQDTLYYVEQGQTSAYIPFAICNGDPCAPATDYNYAITSVGYVGGALDQSGVLTGVVGGTCGDVYGIVDAGAGVVCTYDTLTIVAWDLSGSVYDTCVQAIHVVEPVPVPLFTAPVVTILVLAMILAAAVIMKRHAVSKA